MNSSDRQVDDDTTNKREEEEAAVEVDVETVDAFVPYAAFTSQEDAMPVFLPTRLEDFEQNEEEDPAEEPIMDIAESMDPEGTGKSSSPASKSKKRSGNTTGNSSHKKAKPKRKKDSVSRTSKLATSTVASAVEAVTMEKEEVPREDDVDVEKDAPVPSLPAMEMGM